jgi:hypothetical protein
MQILLSLFSLLLIFQTVVAPYACCAAEVKWTPAASGTPVQVEGTLPATKVGALLAADTLCILSGLTVAIAIQSASGPHEIQMQGHLINNNLTTNGRVGQIQGKAYFDKGPSLKQLGEVKQERVITHNGHTYNGHVVSMDDRTMQFQQDGGPVHNIDLQDVKSIQSSKSLNYKIELKSDTKLDSKSSFTAHAEKITFKPTKAPSTTTDHGNFQKVLVLTTVALLIATAIAVPIAVGVSTHNAHANNIAQQNTNKAVQAILIRRAQLAQAAAIPAKTIMPSQKYVLPNTNNPTLPVLPSTPTAMRMFPGIPGRTTTVTGTTVRGTYP